MSTTTRTIKWIESLAEQELSIKAGERTSLDIGDTKDVVLTVERTTFVRDLFHHFQYLINHFNHRVQDSSLQIKLTRTEEPDSFSLSRNGLKLSLSTPQLGVISLQCDKMLSAENGVKRTSVMFSGMIEARFGTFHDVEWYFLGSRINPEQVARHYLTEFIQVTRNDS